MDESTSALDPPSQEKLLKLIDEKLPDATVISVGHRPELEAFHGRKLVLEHRPGGARIIGDEYLNSVVGAGRRLHRWFGRRRQAEKANDAAADKTSSNTQKPAQVPALVVASADDPNPPEIKKSVAEKV
jgi:putative ATP-binding cassette transporter